MKKNIKNGIFIILILVLVYLSFLNKELLSSICFEAFNVWLTKVFPFLFIMPILNDLLLNYNFDYYLERLLLNFFKKNSYDLIIIFLSLLNGTPSNVYLIKKLYNDGKINLNCANYYLMFTFFSNPLFLYNILNLIFKENIIVIKIILIHYLSNIIIYLFMKKRINNKNIIYYKNPNKFGLVLTNSIKNSININIMVFSTITFYFIISGFLSKMICNIYLITFIKSVLELTQGLNNLIGLNIKLKEIIALLTISFGGLSIHSQVYSIISDSKINYKYFLKGRIISSFVSVILYILI